MIGALAAIEAWLVFDHKAQWKKWLSYLDTIASRVSGIDSIKTSVQEPTGLSNNSPVLVISWDPSRLHITGEELSEELGRNKPRIAFSFGRRRNSTDESGLTSINITAGQMQPGEDKIVADRLYGALSQKRTPKPTAMDAPAGVVSGRWNVNVEFYSSKSLFTWVLEQDGNWLRGIHNGTFSMQNIAGTIEGNQVKIRSAESLPGDHIAFTYTGTLSQDTLSGSIYMVEYGTARFTAQRYKYPEGHMPIAVPGGPPLAT